MGNSNSPLKRSRSQYGSQRSVAFSLPTKWDRHSYAYDSSINRRRPSSASSVHSLPSKPILRNNSNASSLYSGYDAELRQKSLSRSMLSLQNVHTNEQNRFPTSRTTSMSSLQQSNSITPKEYSDIYLKNDLRRVFRAQDRTNSVAQLGDMDVEYLDSTVSLDQKLLALKTQRNMNSDFSSRHQESEDSGRKGAAQRRIRSRKMKLAPSVPNVAQSQTNDYSVNRPTGLYRKKSTSAPQPPLRDKAQSMPSLTIPGSEFDRWQDASQRSLIQEIEAEIKARKNNLNSSNTNNIKIPTPDYDFSSKSSIKPKPAVKPKKIKPPAPAIPVKNKELSLPVHKLKKVDSVDIDESMNKTQVLSVAVDVHTIPPKSREGTGKASISTTVEKNTTTVDTSSEQHFIPRKLAATPAKEVKEIAIQYDAPVEIAIQCSGNTLKEKKTKMDVSSPDNSLSELLQLFNEAIQAGKQEPVSKDFGRVAPALDATDNLSVSSVTSSNNKTSGLKKIVPLHEVLADIPAPPPLPDLNVKLIQTRTITENAPISMAPAEPSPTSSAPEDDSPRAFSTFQQELLKAYKKIEEKRKTCPTETNSKSFQRQASNSSAEASVLSVYRHARTIIGVQTPQESGSDSGHDEPSDCSNSHSDQTPSIPDFVFAGIAKNLHSHFEIHTSRSLQSSAKKDKSKFNSIKRIRQSIKEFVSTKARQTELPDGDVCSQPPLYSHENWTLSGRPKSSRPGIMKSGTFPHGDTFNPATDSFGNADKNAPSNSLNIKR